MDHPYTISAADAAAGAILCEVCGNERVLHIEMTDTYRQRAHKRNRVLGAMDAAIQRVDEALTELRRFRALATNDHAAMIDAALRFQNETCDLGRRLDPTYLTRALIETVHAEAVYGEQVRVAYAAQERR